MNNILVTGAKGQLGSELKALAQNNATQKFFFTDVEDLDITDYKAIEAYVSDHKITSVINCAAYTAVDAAEENESTADAINHKAVEHIANICKTHDIKLIHISTDYVFEGHHFKPYLESYKTNPQSVYGQTKLKGEQAILEVKPSNSLIIRTAWVYSGFGNNFVKTMLKLAKQHQKLRVISDQVGSPTYAKDLAGAILIILPVLNNDAPEIYHYTNQGVCSWYDFAKAIFEIKTIDINVDAIETKDYPTLAQRPYYSVLNTSKIRHDFNLDIRHWKTALKELLN